jgi:hypothetical protein
LLSGAARLLVIDGISLREGGKAALEIDGGGCHRFRLAAEKRTLASFAHSTTTGLNHVCVSDVTSTPYYTIQTM